MDRIEVESMAFVQPYYFVPSGRLVLRPRRRTAKHEKNSIPGQQTWVSTKYWGPLAPRSKLLAWDPTSPCRVL